MTITLSGSLAEFPVSDVLNLLAMSRRTAQVQVHGSTATGSVCLVEGTVCAATADISAASLLRALVASLDVPASDLTAALAEARPARALVTGGAVDAEAARAVAGELCVDALGELLGWAAGQFEVHAGLGETEDLGVRLGVEACVASARERAQQWSDLRARLPEADSVLSLQPGLVSAPVLDLEDWAVVARVDGRRTLGQVLATLGMAPLAAGGRVVELIGGD